jgi:hypothetical protein
MPDIQKIPILGIPLYAGPFAGAVDMVVERLQLILTRPSLGE